MKSDSNSLNAASFSHMMLALIVIASVAGCGSNTQRVQQLQNENDRLLSEFRAQRDQVTQLNERLATLQNRLAESEKLLARQSPIPTSRVSRLNNEPASLPSTGPGKDRASGLSTSKSVTGQTSSDQSAASSNSDLFWRPMRRELP